jgi:hypothetical protein
MFQFAVLLVSSLLLGVLPARAKTITSEYGRIVFDVPADFQPLMAKISESESPSSRHPRYAAGTENAATTITYDVKDSLISADKLDEVRKAFANTFTQTVPGIEWKENKLIKLGGKEWIYFEFESNAVDTDIRNIMLTTDFDGKMLVFNFNSTAEDFEIREPALRASIQSIRVLENASREAPSLGSSQSEDVVEELKTTLQTELKRAGCYHGPIDGIWGDNSIEALADFGERRGETFAELKPTESNLDAVLATKGRVCPPESRPSPVVKRRKKVEPRSASRPARRAPKKKPKKEYTFCLDGRNLIVDCDDATATIKR